MTITKGKTYEIYIHGVGYKGIGISKKENFVIFVDKTVPGDIVKAKIIKKRKNYAEAKIVNFLEYSKSRVEPPCRYSGICGGCKWQFLNYKEQIAYKRQHVLETIEHIALIKNVLVHPTIPSDKIFGYRNKMEFTSSNRRWLLPKEKDSKIKSWFGLGLHVPGTFYKVLDISTCLLQPSYGNNILNDVRLFMKTSKLPGYNIRTHEGFWRFLIIRHSATYDKWMVNIVTSSNNIDKVKPLANILVSKYTNITSIINSITSRKAGVATSKDQINLVGQNTIRDCIGKYDFEISSNSFFQTNTHGARKLYEIIKNYANLSGNELVLDLYCGTGTIAIYLSDFAGKIIGIESVKSAVCDAKRNCNLNKVSNCNFILGDVKEKLSDISISPEIIIIDPPRCGIHKKVIRKIIDISPNKLIYVSCNPATFSRDILELKKRYELLEVQPIDIFPHTYHIELVAKLVKKCV